jgi:hypothetical protein
MHESAEQHFDAYDKHLELDEEQKALMFDDAMNEFTSSIKLLRNKLKVLDGKVFDLASFSDTFHQSTE